MEQRTASRLAWTIWGLSLVLAIVAQTLTVMDRAVARAVENGIFVGIFMAMGAVGALVIGRQRRNAVGWILLTLSGTAGLAFFASEYANHGTFADPGSLPGMAWACGSASCHSRRRSCSCCSRTGASHLLGGVPSSGS
jgi:predicted membrane channel-forming protein YqfA (hemolysin III family)